MGDRRLIDRDAIDLGPVWRAMEGESFSPSWFYKKRVAEALGEVFDAAAYVPGKLSARNQAVLDALPSTPPPLQPAPANVELEELGAKLEPAPSFMVKGWQPGNGSRYDLTFGKRAGGGWFVVWEALGWFAVIYPGSAYRGGRAELSRRVGEWNKPDADAVGDLAGVLIRGGVLDV